MMSEELKPIHDKLDEIIKWQAAHTVMHQMVDRDLEEHRRALFGNGSPGLKATVQRIGQRCDERACSDPIKRAALDVATKVIAGSILMLIGWLLFVAEFIHKSQAGRP